MMMSDSYNMQPLPFHRLCDDDFFDLHRVVQTDDASQTPVNSYDDLIINNINLLSANLDFDFDLDDPAQRSITRYSTVNQLSDLSKKFHKDTFSMLHLNIRSLNKHFDDLLSLVDKPLRNPFSLIGLTETWINYDSHHPFHIDDYEFINKNRQDRIGGGVAFYVLKSFNYTILEEISVCNTFIESLFIEIVVPGNKNIIAGVIYRCPSSNSQEFLQYLSNLLRSINFDNKDFFLMGDFNIDLLNHEINNVSQEFLEIILSASCLPLVSKPTRVANASASLIDNIFSNVISHPDSYIILSDITDHYPIATHYPLSQSINDKGSSIYRRKVNAESLARLEIGLENTNWSCVYNSEDVNVSYEKFSDILNNQLEISMPKQKIKTNYKKIPKLPWISKSILRSINRKNNPLLFFHL